MELFGTHDPAGSDGYAPGAWDEVRSAHLDGHISDAAYERVRGALAMKMLAVGDQWRHTLEYAATALEGSADNGDQYCASQIRQRLAEKASSVFAPPVLDVNAEDQDAEGQRYALAVAEWEAEWALLVDAVAQEAYTESSNLATRYTPWTDLNEPSRDRLREVVRDILRTPTMRTLMSGGS